VLRSVHPGHTLEEVRDHTGFDFDAPAEVPQTVQPDATALSLIRGRIREEISETYPKFAAQLAA
jgi:glutaconate CoA-transferase subunit B